MWRYSWLWCNNGDVFRFLQLIFNYTELFYYKKAGKVLFSIICSLKWSVRWICAIVLLLWGKQDCVYRAVCPSACVNMSQTHFPDNNGPHYPQSWREGMSSPIRAESTKSAYFDCFSAFICCEWKQWSTDHLLSHKKCAVWGLFVCCVPHFCSLQLYRLLSRGP